MWHGTSAILGPQPRTAVSFEVLPVATGGA
jgi:hypothetical protein